MAGKITYKQLMKLRNDGVSMTEIARRYGLSRQRLYGIIREEEQKNNPELKRGPGRPKGSKNKRSQAEQALVGWENNNLVGPAMREDKAELNKCATFFIVECMKLGQSCNRESIDSMTEHMYRYIQLCAATGMPVSPATCYLALGLTNGTVSRWRRGLDRGKDPAYRDFVDQMDMTIHAGLEALASVGSLDRVITIWWEKSHYGMRDDEKTPEEKDDPLGGRKSPTEIAKMYEKLPD